ncbi:MAG: DUF177 domain-containing protein [Elusimicrobia bacterium]|nr:DUF177 domain-containing protein [Elusimicrobiota bacterium]
MMKDETEPVPFRFALTDVKEYGEMDVAAQAPAEAFAGVLSEGSLAGPVALRGVIRRADDDAVFTGSVSGRWRFECSRCLAPVDGEWSETFEATASIDGGPMDLTDEARQSIGLAQPMKVFCKPDCKGLCPTCRMNLNTTNCGHTPTVDAPDTVRPRLTQRRKKG